MLEPFIFSREVVGSELVDRKDEVAGVVKIMRSAGRLFLIGPRRYGKTSILTTAANQATELGVITIQINAEEFVTESALAAEIVAQATKKAGLSFKRASIEALKVFGRLQPLLSYDGIRDTWSAKLTISDVEHPTQLITEALEGLEQLAGKLDRPVALVIDEFQQLTKAAGIVAERQLRAVIQRHRRVSYVFAGSEESMLMAMTGDHNRPFYRLGERRFLGPVPREDFRSHLHDVFTRSGRTISTSAAERILDLAEDVPYSIQRLALECWREAMDTNISELNEDHVEAQLERLLLLNSPDTGKLIGQLTPSQLKALKAVAEIGRNEFGVQPASRQYKLAASTLRRALDALESKGIIRRIYDGNPATRYAFEDPFLGAWVRRRMHI